MISQLEDDHSRLEVASHVARAETAHAAIATFDKAVAVFGVPQRLLTDNGAALNPSRRITVTDLAGEILIEHTKAAPGITYVGNGRSRGERPTTRLSPRS